MPVIQFGEWLPDQPRLGNSCITATNVRPLPRGYAPWLGFGTAASNALASAPVGVISLQRVGGIVEHFAGTTTRLYRLVSGTWTDVSKGGLAYSTGTFWRFALYGERLIATNGIDAVQKFDLGTDSTFLDLAGSPPIHAFPIVVRDFLVAVDVKDGSGFELKWSANNNSEKWSADCGAGAQDFLDGGPVVGGVGGEFGIILQQRGITRMTFVGGDLRFTFDKIEGAVGCASADSIVQVRGALFYLSDEGFQLFDGARSRNISDERVSNTFFAAATDISTVRGAIDKPNSSVVWEYQTASGKKLIAYNYALDRWSESSLAVNGLHSRITSTGDVLAGFNTSTHILAPLDGTALSATVSTGDMVLNENGGVMVRGIRAQVDASYSAMLGKRRDLSDAETTVNLTANSNGRAPAHARGRYLRFEIQPSAGWSELTGVDVEASGIGAKA